MLPKKNKYLAVYSHAAVASGKYKDGVYTVKIKFVGQPHEYFYKELEAGIEEWVSQE